LKNRNEQIKTLRATIEAINFDLKSKEIESFQNQTLRPILKYQNMVFVILFKSYIQKFRISFVSLNEEQQKECIVKAVGQNQLFKNTLIGVVLALFTEDELQIYCRNKSLINKRISNMLIQRLQDQCLHI